MPTSHWFVCGPAFILPLNSVSNGRPPTFAATVTVTCAAAVSEKLTVVARPVPSEAGVIVAGESDRPVTSVVVGVTGTGFGAGVGTGVVAGGVVPLGFGTCSAGIAPPRVPCAG